MPVLASLFGSVLDPRSSLMAIFMVVLGIGYGCFVASKSRLVLADMFGVVGLGFGHGSCSTRAKV